jgi:hypothetical protein
MGVDFRDFASLIRLSYACIGSTDANLEDNTNFEQGFGSKRNEEAKKIQMDAGRTRNLR